MNLKVKLCRTAYNSSLLKYDNWPCKNRIQLHKFIIHSQLSCFFFFSFFLSIPLALHHLLCHLFCQHDSPFIRYSSLAQWELSRNMRESTTHSSNTFMWHNTSRMKKKKKKKLKFYIHLRMRLSRCRMWASLFVGNASKMSRNEK